MNGASLDIDPYARLKLDGKKAFITGGADGIGKAVAWLFCARGTHVAIADRDRVAGEKLAAELQEHDYLADFVETDVTDRRSVAEGLGKAAVLLGGLTTVVNNAGINPENFRDVQPQDLKVENLDPDIWERVMNVNATGVFNVGQLALPYLIEAGGGSVTNASSVARDGRITTAAYSSSKAVDAVLTNVMAQEWARYNIRVNALAPGHTRTKMTDDMDPDARAKVERSYPMRRFAEPFEIAEAYAFLASDAASYITGAVVEVAGGALPSQI